MRDQLTEGGGIIITRDRNGHEAVPAHVPLGDLDVTVLEPILGSSSDGDREEVELEQDGMMDDDTDGSPFPGRASSHL